MEDDLVIAQIGLLLTQMRYTRRALEDIERSTARYAGFEFASALSQGKAFGQPPLANGALKVYVINIDDLVPTNSLGDLFAGLLGGVGRFIGGLGGGLVGGTLGGLALPDIIKDISKIADTVERLCDRLGIRGPKTGAAEANAKTGQTAGEKAEKGTGTDLSTTLKDVKPTVDAFTALFQAASGDPNKAAKTSNLPVTDEGKAWMAMLDRAYLVLDGIQGVINGLILLIPMVVGALAVLLVRLDTIKLAIVELLQFAYQNVFLLRGILLLTIFDTAAAAARLGASILGILGTMVSKIIQSIFSIIGSGLIAVFAAFDFIGAGLQATVQAVVQWISDALFTILNRLADTALVRVIVHIVNVLPAVLPPLFEIIRKTPMDPTQAAALTALVGTGVAGPSFTGPAPKATVDPFPNIATTFAPLKGRTDLDAAVAKASKDIGDEADNILGVSRGALADVAKKLDDAASSKAFDEAFKAKARAVGARSDDLAKALAPAQEAAAKGAPTGLKAIADEYEKWLTGGGLKDVLGRISDHFKERPDLPNRIAEGAVKQPRAKVEIESVTFEIGPPVDATKGPEGAKHGAESSSFSLEKLRELFEEFMHDHDERGGAPLVGVPK